MSAAHAMHLIQTPQECTLDRDCIQSARLAVLEERNTVHHTQLNRMEGTLDRLQWWLLGTAVSACGATIAALLSMILRLNHA